MAAVAVRAAALPSQMVSGPKQPASSSAFEWGSACTCADVGRGVGEDRGMGVGGIREVAGGGGAGGGPATSEGSGGRSAIDGGGVHVDGNAGGGERAESGG